MLSMKNVDFETMLRQQCALMGDRLEAYGSSPTTTKPATSTSEFLDATSSKMFTCKTCGKKFHSFQALGGHRASHKKMTAALMAPTTDQAQTTAHVVSPPKPKNHSCPICGIEFPIGQALGGHMRRHRNNNIPSHGGGSTLTTDNSTAENSDGNNKKSIVLMKREREDGHHDGEKKRRIRDDDVEKGVCLELSLSPGFSASGVCGGDVAKGGDVRHDDDVEEGEIVEQAEEVTLDLELKLASW